MSVYLLTRGSGDDGDEWHVVGIYSTMEKAKTAKFLHDMREIERADGTTYTMESNEIEEWELDPDPESP